MVWCDPGKVSFVSEKQIEDLVEQARDEYGELITSIVVFPEDGGLSVHLIGGEGVCYMKDGSTVSTWTVPFRIRVSGHLAYGYSRARRALMVFVEKYE